MQDESLALATENPDVPIGLKLALEAEQKAMEERAASAATPETGKEALEESAKPDETAIADAGETKKTDGEAGLDAKAGEGGPEGDAITALRAENARLEGDMARLQRANAENPKLYKALESRNRTIEELKSKLDGLSSRFSQIETDVKRQTETPKSAREEYGLDDSEAELGDEVVNVTRKVVRKESEKLTQKLIARLDELDAKLAAAAPAKPNPDTTTAQSDDGYESFLHQVGQYSPTWQDDNTNPEFLGWLNEVDPATRAPRRIGLENAARELDAISAASYFREWRSGRAAPVAKPKGDAKPEIEAQVVPAARANGPVKPKKRIYTEADILQMKADASRGTKSPEEINFLLKELDDAIAEGRAPTR